jgi:uncharacterized protein GlcG (DUF336 family)
MQPVRDEHGVVAGQDRGDDVHSGGDRGVDRDGDVVEVPAGRDDCRQDGAIKVSIDIAQKKARTAILMEIPTSALMPLVQPGAELYGVEQTSGGLVAFGGGSRSSATGSWWARSG